MLGIGAIVVPGAGGVVRATVKSPETTSAFNAIVSNWSFMMDVGGFTSGVMGWIDPR